MYSTTQMRYEEMVINRFLFHFCDNEDNFN